MIALRRRAALPLIAAAILVAGCGAAATPRPSATPSKAPSPAALTPVPGGTAPTLPSTTETAFGRIWDALPSWFPKLPGQQPADTGAGPTSGSLAANIDVASATKLVEAALASRGFTVDAGSPLEDGTVVLDASGAREGCVAEVRFTPLSGTVVMSVLYGAECPFS